MDEAKGRKLARHRVGEDKSNGIEMSKEEIDMRRKFIRTMLWKVSPWKDLKDEQLDNIRIFKSGTEWYVEDQDFYEYPF